MQDALPLFSTLDPRPAVEASRRPFSGCVNIPLTELRTRVNELPRKGARIHVAADTEGGVGALQVLAGLGYEAVPVKADEGIGEVGRLWSPNSFLEQVASTLPPGRALDLGCGTGRDAVWLAANGWRVTALDHLPDAIQRGREMERRYAPAAGIRWICSRFDEFDEREAYDLILSFFAYRRSLRQLLSSQARFGACLLMESFSEEHRERCGKPAADAVLTEEEVLTLSGWTVIKTQTESSSRRSTMRAELHGAAV